MLWGKFDFKGLQEGNSDGVGAECVSENVLTLRDFCENWEFSDLVFEVVIQPVKALLTEQEPLYACSGKQGV